MAAGECSLLLALAVVTVVAHVLSVVLLVGVGAVKDLSSLSLELSDLGGQRL